MTTSETTDKVTYEQFRDQWLSEIEADSPSSLEKGRRFAAKLVTQWIGITTDDDDFVICDGSGDGGIDVAYLQRADGDSDSQDDNAIEGDAWYIVQSKYGAAFAGSETIMAEGGKVIETLAGQNQRLSDDSRRLVQKLNLFKQQAAESDRIILVIATTDPIAQQDRQALENIKTIGRERVFQNFDVGEVSLRTIWEVLDDVKQPKLSVPIAGNFVEQASNLLVGTVPLLDLFKFLKEYQRHTGNLDQLYERNVRQFLGSRRKINKGIAHTLNNNPDKFGLYNNGITLVVSKFSRTSSSGVVTMDDPYVVNGCQTTRTIWQVLDSKLQAGGTGQSDVVGEWRELAERGGVVTKIVSSDDAEIINITRFTNSQNSVREQDFLALDSRFQSWANDMAQDRDIYLEIQRGGIESRKAWEKQHPEAECFEDYVNAFDLIKVYGAGWIGVPGIAFGKNAPFLPKGSVYERMMNRPKSEPAFGARDLYAAYKVKCVADYNIGFGRNAEQPSRRQSKFLFYHIIMQMLSNVILLSPQFPPPVTESVLTDAVLKLSEPESEEAFEMLQDAAIDLIDQYLTAGNEYPNSAYKELSFNETHNGDMNAFLKAESLGTDSHSPLLVQLIAQHNQGFSSIRLRDREGRPTQREFVARALADG